MLSAVIRSQGRIPPKAKFNISSAEQAPRKIVDALSGWLADADAHLPKCFPPSS